MSATVSDFGERRRKRNASKIPTGNFACPECGEEWFMAKVAVARRRGETEPGDVVGYAHPLRCVTCGWAQP
jgi:predicted RNA-binding Zn-ribbon protein involved in translation (DUF1610 family)